ncbi:hypothetical protein IF2G_09984 [Cordyceps javanica]|nr:hypothetical protein IF2G_09984 [Cordyceps javanica]
MPLLATLLSQPNKAALVLKASGLAISVLEVGCLIRKRASSQQATSSGSYELCSRTTDQLTPTPTYELGTVCVREASHVSDFMIRPVSVQPLYGVTSVYLEAIGATRMRAQ